MERQAGVQFSLPLIDFTGDGVPTLRGWGSVLITPDRLPVELTDITLTLGFSSHYP